MQVECIDSRQLDGSRCWQAQVIMAMPSIDTAAARRCASLMASRAGADGLILIIHDSAREGFIRIANRAFACSESAHFGYVGEDAFPGRWWLKIALFAMVKRGAKLLAFNDGKWLGKMASFGLAERRWARTIYGGQFFYPGYRQHYADYELSRIAQHQQTFFFEPASLLAEIDWDKDYKRTNRADKALFRQREAIAFDGRILQ